jgi:mutator protein MutT
MGKIIKNVVGALVESNGSFLVTKRKAGDTFGGFWEFPGGGIEAGETRESALKREINEELGVDIEVGDFLIAVEDENARIKIVVYLFEAKIVSGTPRPIDCAAVKWASIEEMAGLHLAPADSKIAEWLSKRGT